MFRNHSKQALFRHEKKAPRIARIKKAEAAEYAAFQDLHRGSIRYGLPSYVFSVVGWRLWLGIFLVIFAYGVGRYPIVRGTQKEDLDGEENTFLSLATLWFAVAFCIAFFIFVIQQIREF
jgi:hypothetical protein